MKENNLDIEILPLKVEYIDDVTAIENTIFSRPWSKDDFLDCIKSNDKHYFCAISNGKTLGYCGYWGISDEAQIYNVAVKPEERGRGIARRLLEHLINFAISDNKKVCFLEVRVSNMIAKSLYKSLGFREDSIRRNFYDFPMEDALLMSLKI